MDFYGKLEFPGPGHFSGPRIYYRNSYEMAEQRRLWETVGRPVVAHKLSRDAYFAELDAGMGHEWHAVPASPPTAGEVAMEAQRILYRLHKCYERSRWLADLAGFYVVAVSDSFAARAGNARLEDLRREFPHKGVRIKALPRQSYLCFPDQEKEKRECIGLMESEKRFRDKNGKLTCSIETVMEQTRKDGDLYFTHGEQYIIQGMLFTCYRYRERDSDGERMDMCLFTNGVQKIFCSADSLGSCLPDVASAGREHVAVKDGRFQPLPCLTNSLRAYIDLELKEARR